MGDDTTKNVDIRSDDDKEVDTELDDLFEQYEQAKADDKSPDEPIDDNLAAIDATDDPPTDTTMTDDETTPTKDDYAEDTAEDTGETTVTISEEVDPDEADFGADSDPDAETVAEVSASDEKKQQRRKELQESGHLPVDETDETATPADEDDTADGGRYGIDASVEETTDTGTDTGTDTDTDQPDPEPEPDDADIPQTDYDPETNPIDQAEFDDVMEQGLFEDASDDVPEDFDWEDQDIEGASERKDDKVIPISTGDGDQIYVKLVQPTGDAFYNLLDRAQQAEGIEQRHDLLIDTVVERPRNIVERTKGWAAAKRSMLATECAVHSGLDELNDFQQPRANTPSPQQDG